VYQFLPNIFIFHGRVVIFVEENDPDFLPPEKFRKTSQIELINIRIVEECFLLLFLFFLLLPLAATSTSKIAEASSSWETITEVEMKLLVASTASSSCALLEKGAKDVLIVASEILASTTATSTHF